MTKQDLLKRNARIIRECRQTIRDAEWWAANRTDAEPLDVEPVRVMLVKAIACRKAIIADDRESMLALSKDLSEYAAGAS